MTLDVVPSGQVCGATVRGVDLRGGLHPDEASAVRAAWLDHKVLAFPDQQLSDHDLEAFTLAFGPFGDDPFFESIDGHPNIAAIHRGATETASLFADTWHADWSFQTRPPDGTCLYGIVIPPVGGDTLFIDQQAALAAMPDDLRRRIDGKRAVHSARRAYAPDGLYGDADEGSERLMRIRIGDEANATETHPLVMVHPETGASTLYGTFGYIIGIEGMGQAAADELLLELYAWQTREEFRYRHVWKPHMLVMWDNRCVLHKATGGYEGHERLLHRTTIGYNAEVGARVRA